MFEPWNESWFWPCVAVVVGLPVLLLVLTEVHSALVRRQHPAAKVVSLVRNYLVPVGALLVLVSQTAHLNVDVTWTRVVATVFGFLLILVLLNGVNAALFGTAEKGTWRDRMPSIFVDILRLLLIVVCLAVLFAWVWDADVGGLFTALGVSSIVIGLALQNAVGPIVSGLFLLFEQPFRMGDWLDLGDVRGRVVEVNWRAVHIDTGNGIQIVPNGSLAGSSFTNLSKVPGPYYVTATLTYATDDAPQDVVAMLRKVAGDLPMRDRREEPSAYPVGGGSYAVNIPVQGPSSEEPAMALFLTWLWYASRRAGLHLDNDLTDDYITPERLRSSLVSVASSLHLREDELSGIVDKVELVRFGAGETLQLQGQVPLATSVIVSGSVQLGVVLDDESSVRAAVLGPKDFIGLAALTRRASSTTVTALTDTTVIVVPIAALDELVRSRPLLARELSQMMDQRAEQAKVAVETGLAEVNAGR